MLHVIEVTAPPYSPGNPRRYYAADYFCWQLVHDGVTYEVREIDGVAMFVAI